MTKSLFNDEWTVRRKVSGFVDLLGGTVPTAVTLPHDAMRELPRSAQGGGGPSTAFFPGGEVEYTKRFTVPDEWRQRRVSIEFEGVYRDAMIYVNGEFAGQWRYGYSVFRISLDAHLRYGQENTISVEARAHQDSRWYSGLGIYRDVHLVVAPLAHIADDRVRITTPDVDDERAVVETVVMAQNEDLGTRRLTLEVEICDAAGDIVARDGGPVTVRPGSEAVARHRLYVDAPKRWGVDDPHLYRFTARLLDEDGLVIDAVEIPFGIRTVRVDPRHGLRINDEVVKLRGACVHHDNGPLGAATIRRADERRVEILKSAGFNAIRSSHNPLSPAMLDACDRLGMLVFDETFDAWTEMNKPFDYTLDFTEWWERDVDAMVRKDFNHPSVILYSIGNEIHEYGTGAGAVIARDIAERIRAQDSTRFITTAISGFWAVASDVIDDLRSRLDDAAARGVNDVMNEMTEFFDDVTVSEIVGEKTAEAHGVADVAGLNYAEARYAPDGERFPNRVVLGTETNPRETASSWLRTMAHPHVIGGFTWTGWDYLGEVGLGRTDYTDDPDLRGGGDPEFPWLTSWAGDIDITGIRRPQSYFREIVFGLRSEPYIAVRRPLAPGIRRLEMQWAWSDAISSWTWAVEHGTEVEVEVYSDADEVELELNGRSLGRRAAGAEHGFRATFTVPYEPGVLAAFGLARDGSRSRTELHTAEAGVLSVVADRSELRADDGDLAFLSIELRDGHGVLDSARETTVTVRIEGPGTLQALASARPSTEESFTDPSWRTFDGRALAIVRPTGPGEITAIVTSEAQEESIVRMIAT
jgi:beta-galactosidase